MFACCAFSYCRLVPVLRETNWPYSNSDLSVGCPSPISRTFFLHSHNSILMIMTIPLCELSVPIVVSPVHWNRNLSSLLHTESFLYVVGYSDSNFIGLVIPLLVPRVHSFLFDNKKFPIAAPNRPSQCRRFGPTQQATSKETIRITPVRYFS
jgi:hypothetical protein